MVFFLFEKGGKSSLDVFYLRPFRWVLKDATLHLLSIQSFHIALLIYEEMSLEILKAAPLIHEMERP